MLAVGRRRHADLSGDGRELPEPAWLREAYAASRDLLDADGRSFRFVISAVMACRRELFEDLGGFDERFVGYGGEDWDLAYRAWNAGAVLVHEPAAVAWHDGPDWAGRPEDRATADQRDGPAGRAGPGAADPRGAAAGAAARRAASTSRRTTRAACTRSCARRTATSRCASRSRASCTPARCAREPWTADQQARARVHLRLDSPVPLGPGVVADLVARLTDGGLGELLLTVDGAPVGVATSTRAAGRARRWSGREDDVVGRCFGRDVAEVAVVAPRQTLDGFLAAPW